MVSSIITMGRISMAFVLAVMFLGLMAASTMADSTTTRESHEQVHSQRLLQASTSSQMPGFKPRYICGGLGPACPDGVHIECVVGGVVGCICALVRTCQPTVSGCTLFHGASATPCGF